MDVTYSREKEDGDWVAELKQCLKLRQAIVAEEAEGGAEMGHLQVLTLRQVLVAAPVAVGQGEEVAQVVAEGEG